ncbi:pyridoxal phosphate-dependent aminotransferase [Streptomyces sp. NPDC058424]|uniref:pyridoxal phosphate-dependent aminotransferase n=1 Tax=Streptomyces sp. NPDC058424 TaxID=3346491 RepID=UPI00364C8382
MKLSRAAANRPKSGVRKMMELAWGRDDVVHLEVGEPGFPTPAHVRAAAQRAAEQGHTRYAPTPGLPELKEALTHKLRTVNRIQVPGSHQVVVSNGGANALFAVFGSVLDPGDSILIPDPGWSNFTMMANAFGARPKYYRLTAEGGYLPDPEQIAALIDDSTKAVVLNSPSNPLGSVIPRELAERLFEVCAEKDVWIISDECYDGIDFSGEFVSIGSLESEPQRVISVFSFSKVYAMTGWRIGYCALPSQVVDPVLTLLQPSVMCVNTPAQFAALAAITGPQDYLNEWREQYRENRDLVLNKISGSPFTAHVPDGGFYVWLSTGDCGLTSEEFTVKLLTDRRVALTPGTAFGAFGEGHVRLSLATSRDQLAEGIDRLLA